jgi:hypothetical protein
VKSLAARFEWRNIYYKDASVFRVKEGERVEVLTLRYGCIYNRDRESWLLHERT